MNEAEEPVRIDKWLWAARFFKTRSLAAEAVSGGKIEINGNRAKPGRIVRAGDTLAIRRGPYEWTVVVKEVARLRGPASRAQQLYEETEASTAKRRALAAQLKLEQPFDAAARPSKKQRRALIKFTRRRW